ncbi:MAG: GTP-binding protein [Proteobacteria bacterium]|nr:GTP-binding protein [Pseudomonadota bacterium]
MSEPTKIILLSGFLGSGKTTLLKHMMSLDEDMSDTVILMNEFGEVGIDGMLIKNIGTDVVELTSGCICCSMSDDFLETIDNVLERFGPRYIVIEATGVADPESVTTVIESSSLKNDVKIQNIVTVLDAECWKVRDVFGTLFYRQLKQADTIIFNKIDLLAKEDIPEYLKEIHQKIPGSQVIPAVNCRVEPEIVWSGPVDQGGDENVPKRNSRGHRRHNQEIFPFYDHETGTGRRHETIFADADFVTFSFSESAPLDEDAFKRFVQEMPFELFRLKGTVHFEDRTVMINSVGGKTELVPWERIPETRLAFVGWNIDPDEFLSKLKACLKNK